MNKLNIGNKVELKTKSHKWHTDHINAVFLRPESSEFEVKDYEDIAILLLSKSRRDKLKGKVVSYGSRDEDYKDGRSYVKVVFKYKGMTTDFYCSEKDVKKL